MATTTRRSRATATRSSNGDGRDGSRHDRNGHSPQPRLGQTGAELQRFGSLRQLPIALAADARAESCRLLSEIQADSMILAALYKKAHWNAVGPTFYQLHLLFDKHYEELDELVDVIAERIQLLGGISIAMAADVAETTRIPRPPKGREEVPVQISRLLQAHEMILEEAHRMAEEADDKGDDGTNDLIVSDVIRTNELQVWFVAEHVVDAPLVHADGSNGNGC